MTTIWILLGIIGGLLVVGIILTLLGWDGLKSILRRSR